MAGSIGYSTLSIIPNAKGFGAAVSAQAGPGMTAAGAGLGKMLMAGLAGAATVGAAAVVGLFKVGETFDQMSDTIRVGTGATGDALEALNQSAKRVGQDVPASFGDVGTAIADLNTRTGQTGPGLEALASQMLEMTRIAGGDLSGNIASVTRVFGDWSISTGDQAGTMDYLFKVSQTTGIGIDSLSSKVVQFGAPLRQLGFDFETSAALLGKWEQEGVNTEAVLAGMKIGLGQMSKAGKEPVQALRDVQAAIAGAGSAGEANQIAIETFGQRAGPDMAAAIREGRFSVDELLGTLSASGETILGAAADTESFGEKWLKFKNNVLVKIEPIATRVFDAFGVGMDWISSTGAPALEAFGAAFSEKVGPAISAVGDYVTDTLIPGISSLVGWLKENEAWLTPIAVGIGAMVVAFQTYAAVMAVIRIATAAWAVVQGVLNVALSANPIGIVVLAIIGLVAALVYAWNNSETFRNIVTGVWDAIKTAVSAVANWFTVTIPALWDSIATWTTDKWNAILDFFRAIPGAIVNFFKNWTLIGLLITHWDSISAKARSMWDGLVSFVKGIPGRFVAGLAAIGTTVRSKVSGWVSRIKDAAVEKFTALVTWVTGLPGRIVGALGNLGNLLLNAGRNIISGLLSGIREKFEAVKDFVGGIGSWIADHKGPKAYDLALLKPAGGWIMQGLQDGIEGSVPGLERTLAGVSATVARTRLTTGDTAARPGSTGLVAGGVTFNAPVYSHSPGELASAITTRMRDFNALHGGASMAAGVG